MCVRKALLALAVLALLPGVAAAQPVVYVCTQAAQVVKVDATNLPATTGVIYNGSGSFNDCVFGPDGKLYVANQTATSNQVIRFDPASPPPSGQAQVVTTATALASAARSLRFNVTTLYVSTASSGVRAFPGISESTATVPTAGVQAITGVGAGQGMTFSIDGRLWFVSGATVRQSLPNYTTSAALISSGLTTPEGVGTNTCGNLLVADQGLNTIRRYNSSGTFQNNYLNFGQINALNNYFPRHLEIDASNRTYVVADSTNKNALIVRVGPAQNGVDPTGSCVSVSEAQVQILAELRTSGSGAIPGLLSNRAVGIALGPTHHQITKTFPAGVGCNEKFNFGYHTVRLSFAECLTTFSLTASALKSTPEQVIFANDPTQFPTQPIEGMRYSPLEGFIIQYVYLPVPPATSLPAPGVDFANSVQPPAKRGVYGFFTQELLATPGLARTPNDGLTATYTESIGHDFWDVGILDPGEGEVIPDWSKRVVFNSGLAAACTFGGFQEPLNTGNPQFNSGQNIKIAFQLSGPGCGDGVLHVSLVRLLTNDYEVIDVTSGQQQDNIMDVSGPGNYHYNLDTVGYVPGNYQITIWGNVIAPINKTFEMLQ
jgi:hypothetical protein